MKCVSCGSEIGEARACRWCGTVQPSSESDDTTTPPSEQAEQTAEEATQGEVEKPSEEDGIETAAEPSPEDEKRRRASKGRRLVAMNAGIAAVLVAFITFTLATAEHWEKVDVPAHDDLASAREVPTGNYIVTMDSINPCYVGQDYTDCINAYINQYNAACTLPITASSAFVCINYERVINDMQAKDFPGAFIGELPNDAPGQLTAVPETEIVYDTVPAQTHEAVCYLGFIGECRQDETTEGD